MIAEKMRELGMKVLDPVLRIQYQPADKDIEECKRLGKDIAVKVKKIPEKHGKSTSGSKIEDADVQEVKMGDGGH